MRYLLAALILFSANVYADKMVARDSSGNVIVLLDQPCLASPWLKEWKTASLTFEGKVFAACWSIRGSDVVVLDAAGDVYPIPAGMFQKETGV